MGFLNMAANQRFQALSAYRKPGGFPQAEAGRLEAAMDCQNRQEMLYNECE
jgi:hypothetical protein